MTRARGLDEVLVQYDEPGAAWWTLPDGGGDLAALCDLGAPAGEARVVGQWTWDAYGDPLSADHLFDFPQVHLGHKGLFLDRLDAGVLASDGTETPRLVPFARALYQNRNRAYSPGLGRFMQRDPYQGAITLVESRLHGQSPAVGEVGLDFEEWEGDGLNRYEYLRSGPWDRTDRLGLMVDLFLPGPEEIITGVLESLVTDYAANLEWDVDWAMDMALPDDDHSRIDNTWMAFAMGRGLYDAFWLGVPGTEIGFNPFDLVAGKAGKGARRGPPRAFRGETIYTKRGRAAHENYKLAVGPGYRFNERIPGGGRPDAIDWDRRIVRELKPDSPSGIARGARQLARYVRGLEEATGQKWRGYLDLYKRDW